MTPTLRGERIDRRSRQESYGINIAGGDLKIAQRPGQNMEFAREPPGRR